MGLNPAAPACGASTSPTSDVPPSMHRMFAVHEILSNILEYSKQHDQAMAARVSHLWCDVVVDWLWRDLVSVLPLLRLLAPLEDTSTGLAFAEKIEARNWERFKYYARRVRCLWHDDSDADALAHLGSTGLTPDISVILLTLKPPGFGELLPKLRELRWSVFHDIVNLPHALPFIQPSIKVLAISLDELGDDQAVARFFNTISSMQVLCLEEFTFDMVGLPRRIVQSVASFLQLQPMIESLDLPIMGVPPESDIAQDLIHPILPANLKRLTTRIIFWSPGDYTTRARAIVQRVPQLKVLELFLNGVDSWWPSTFENLSPFMALSNLEELELITLHGFHLDPHEIAALGRSFPKMTKLSLQPSPQLSFSLGIEATSLVDFAKAFPNLQTLNIHIETIYSPLQLPWRSTEQPEAQAHTPFGSLTFLRLDIGYSFLEDDNVPDMAELLCMIWDNPLFEIEYEGKTTAVEDRAKAWRKVEALLKVVRGAERDTSKPYHEWCRTLILENIGST